MGGPAALLRCCAPRLWAFWLSAGLSRAEGHQTRRLPLSAGCWLASGVADPHPQRHKDAMGGAAGWTAPVVAGRFAFTKKPIPKTADWSIASKPISANRARTAPPRGSAGLPARVGTVSAFPSSITDDLPLPSRAGQKQSAIEASATALHHAASQHPPAAPSRGRPAGGPRSRLGVQRAGPVVAPPVGTFFG